MNTRFLIDADGQKTAVVLSIRDFRTLVERLEELEGLQLIEKRMYRIRVGDYRIVYEVAGDELIIIAVSHRKDIYRDLE